MRLESIQQPKPFQAECGSPPAATFQTATVGWSHCQLQRRIIRRPQAFLGEVLRPFLVVARCGSNDPAAKPICHCFMAPSAEALSFPSTEIGEARRSLAYRRVPPAEHRGRSSFSFLVSAAAQPGLRLLTTARHLRRKLEDLVFSQPPFVSPSECRGQRKHLTLCGLLANFGQTISGRQRRTCRLLVRAKRTSLSARRTTAYTPLLQPGEQTGCALYQFLCVRSMGDAAQRMRQKAKSNQYRMPPSC